MRPRLNAQSRALIAQARRFRIGKGISQHALAELMTPGRAQSSVSEIESGTNDFRMNTVMDYLNAMGLTLSITLLDEQNAQEQR